MKKLSWAVALAAFLVFFGVYSFRLGIEPAFRHDDYVYTYPSFSLAERGDFGSPLFGPGLNVEKRTYALTGYYYFTVPRRTDPLSRGRPAVDPAGQHLPLRAAGGGRDLLSDASRCVPRPVRLFVRAHERRKDGHRRAPRASGDDGWLLPDDGSARLLALARGGSPPAVRALRNERRIRGRDALTHFGVVLRGGTSHGVLGFTGAGGSAA